MVRHYHSCLQCTLALVHLQLKHPKSVGLYACTLQLPEHICSNLRVEPSRLAQYQ